MFRIFKKRTPLQAEIPLQAELLKLRSEFPGQYCSVKIEAIFHSDGEMLTMWELYVNGFSKIYHGSTFEKALKSIIAERDVIAERDSKTERNVRR